jgi:hypothetical protein
VILNINTFFFRTVRSLQASTRNTDLSLYRYTNSFHNMGERTEQSVLLSIFIHSKTFYFSPRDDHDSPLNMLKLNVIHIIKSKRIRNTAAASVIVLALRYVFLKGFYVPSHTLIRASHVRQNSTVLLRGSSTDWSQYAYTQYVTNEAYLCNSVMIFEALHRLGSKAERLMMYPSTMDLELGSEASQLLQKAQNDYAVKLMPIEVQHRDGGDCKRTKLLTRKYHGFRLCFLT